jgi:hypothetical protein
MRRTTSGHITSQMRIKNASGSPSSLMGITAIGIAGGRGLAPAHRSYRDFALTCAGLPRLPACRPPCHLGAPRSCKFCVNVRCRAPLRWMQGGAAGIGRGWNTSNWHGSSRNTTKKICSALSPPPPFRTSAFQRIHLISLPRRSALRWIGLEP